VRQREFVLGRSAMRAALGQDVAILPDDRGAPVMPAGWIGSISHKGDVAAALIARDEGARVGLDLELAAPSRLPIERRILTARERESIVGARITLAFSIKEAIYKAIDPYVRRYVGFTEVELALGDLGVCAVTTALPFRIEAWWCEHAGHWVTAARARQTSP
jgi:4'-phosphopantetheinyl transferase EntD